MKSDGTSVRAMKVGEAAETSMVCRVPSDVITS